MHLLVCPMSNIPTCAVRSTVRDSVGGQPVPNATVTARLSTYEVFEGYVVPRDVVAKTDVNGEFVLNLFPNELGAAESFYDVKIVSPSGKTLRSTAVVPNLTTVDLSEIADLPVFPGRVNATLRELDQATQAARDAEAGAVGARDEAVPAATTATEQASIARAQAEVSAAQAVIAALERVGAETAKNQALGAALAAAITGNAAADIATGRATVVDYQPFSVRPNTTDGLKRVTLFCERHRDRRSSVTLSRELSLTQ